MDKKTQQLLRKIRKACNDYSWEEVSKHSCELVENIKLESIRDPEIFISHLTSATERYDEPRVKELIHQQIFFVKNNQDNLKESHKIKILKILKSKRYFKLIERFADAIIFSGAENETVLRLYAQAMIEQGRFACAEQWLNKLISKLPSSHPEYREAQGLKGRLYKQHFVNTAAESNKAKKNLIKSIDSYQGVYSKDKNAFWHGINLVALLERAKRSRVKLPRPLNAQRISKEILKQIEHNKCPEAWELAAASEACMGLGDLEAALDWAVKYTHDERADAFEIASTLRQFKEVWQLDPAKPEHSKILHVLNSGLLEREGGTVDIAPYDQQGINPQELMSTDFEKILGEDGPKKFRWYLNGIKRAQAVGIIRNRNGQGVGTGFLVQASDLNSSWGSSMVMVTNEHVVSEQPGVRLRQPLLPEQVRVMFEVLPEQNIEYSVAEVLWSSPQNELDVTIFKLDKLVSSEVELYPITKLLPAMKEKKRVYIIGHPMGGGLSLSIHDNILLDHKDPKIHYRTPTEPGSSGSPVFNDEWELLAVHHAGSENMNKLSGQGSYPANEGIWIQSILRAINN